MISTFYGVDVDKIHVVPNVVDTDFFFPKSDNERGTEPYLLTVGSTWKHKNVHELLAMHKCWSEKYSLRVVAGEGQYAELLRRMVTDLGIGEKVTFLSRVSREELRQLYQHCAALVFPSIMEGFGIPPLEAMACGRPAIVSECDLFRELYGDVPLYVKLGDERSWRLGLQRLDQYPDERREAGVELAKTFNHDRMQKALWDALHAAWGIEMPPLR